MLLAAWRNDSLSARVGAALAGLWSETGPGGMFLPNSVKRGLWIRETPGVHRSLTYYMASGRDPSGSESEAGLVLGHLGFPVDRNLAWREAAALSSEAGTLGLERWPDLVWVLPAEDGESRVAAAHLGRIGAVVGARRITVILMSVSGRESVVQASLVRLQQGLYRTVAGIVGASCLVVSLNGGGGLQGFDGDEVLVPLLQKALMPA